MPDLWFRNPLHYVQQVVQAGEKNIAFDLGFLVKRKTNALQFCKLYFGTRDFNLMIISSDGAQVFDQNCETLDEPISVYPVWDTVLDAVPLLQEIMHNPVSENSSILKNKSIPDRFKPKLGQKHVIVIHNVPALNTNYGKRMLMYLRDFQQENPQCRLFIHGTYSWAPLIEFDLDFDAEVRTMSANKRLWLPPGKQVHVEKELHRHQKWVHLLGYSVPQLRSSAPDRCLYNIESLRWACQHGTKDLAWAFVDGGREPDKSLPNADFIPNTTSNVMSNQRVTSMPGDKFACDTCSLSQTCKLFKVGSVCTLPESETKSIADKIKSRNTNDILDALADMAAAQANRAQSGMAFEVDFGLDPAVDKTIKSAFEMTERLAKLNDPSLRASISLQKIQRVGEIPQVPKQALPDPAEAVRNAIAYYQAQGFSPTEITPSMIKEYVKNLSAPQEIEPPKPAEDADELLEGELLDETIPVT